MRSTKPRRLTGWVVVFNDCRRYPIFYNICEGFDSVLAQFHFDGFKESGSDVTLLQNYSGDR